MKLKYGRSLSTSLNVEVYPLIEIFIMMIAILELWLMIKIPIVALMTPKAQRIQRETPVAVVIALMALITVY